MRQFTFLRLVLGVSMAVLTCGCGGSGNSTGTSPSPASALQIWDQTASAKTGSPSCPTIVTFEGLITYSGSGNLTYRWDLWDGTSSDTQGLSLSGPANVPGIAVRGTASVPGYAKTVSTGGSYWAKLHILTPFDAVSTPGSITVTCGGT